MDVWELCRILVRRWLIVLPVLGLTLVAVLQVGHRVSPDYAATGSFLIAGPVDRLALERNPLATAGGQSVIRSLSIASTSPDFVRRVVAAGNSSDYVVAPLSNSPIMQIKVTGDSAAQAVRTVRQVTNLLAVSLRQQQAALGAPVASFLHMQVLVNNVQAEADRTPVLQRQAIALAVGLLLAGILALIADTVQARRHRRSLLSGLDRGLDPVVRSRILTDRLRIINDRMRLLDERERLILTYAGAPRTIEASPSRFARFRPGARLRRHEAEDPAPEGVVIAESDTSTPNSRSTSRVV